MEIGPNEASVVLGRYLPLRKKSKIDVPLGSKWLVANFSNWTSENAEIDKFIQKHQRTKNRRIVFVWIDPSRLTNVEHIADGGFGSIYRATWLDFRGYKYGKRGTPGLVALKTFKGNGTIMNFLKEVFA